MFRVLSPRLFVSYSRRDRALVEPLVRALQSRGFRVFLDTSDIDPGDNFVTKLTLELKGATAIVALISESYASSRWGQAELHHAIAMKKTVIPLLTSGGAISELDEPLQRLLRDTQFVDASGGAMDLSAGTRFAEMLLKARRKHRWNLLKRLAPLALVAAVFLLSVWWAVSYSNELERSRRREGVLREITEAKAVLQRERIAALSTLVAGDRQAIGEVMYLSQDPSQSDTARFNALALGSELRKGQKKWRWYVKELDVERVSLDNVALANTSFLGGTWQDLEVRDSTFSGTYWSKSKEKGSSLSKASFRNVGFFGGEIDGVVAVDVAFINAKFRGVVIDTTNFSKVRFVTEEPVVEGNPVITPEYALIERSTVISRRSPPDKGVLDLTLTGDDVVFDGVVFIDCRLEGWFRPEWFRNSSFERCALPESLTEESLEKAGNTVTRDAP
ncbi:MAG TPA: toll/interleukin-1 receptor domain-containing protein [Thermoanaerobaculia bacterium]|nr:toll/interleukin-1 receptor domain-containing protein [Thermoanaerobaculia bacterium]